MGVRAEAGPADLPPIAIELLFAEPALDEGASVDARRRVRLKIQQIPAVAIVGPAEEMIEPQLEYLRHRSVTGDVAAELAVSLVGAHDHREGVPTHDRGDPRLHCEIAGKPALLFERNGIAIGRKRQHIGVDPELPRLVLERRQNEFGALGAGMTKHRFEQIQPIGGFRGIAVSSGGEPRQVRYRAAARRHEVSPSRSRTSADDSTGGAALSAEDIVLGNRFRQVVPIMW